MISAQDVAEVARTGKSVLIIDPVGDPVDEITIDYIVRHTTDADWDGALFELTDRAAFEIAAMFNTTHGTDATILAGSTEDDEDRVLALAEA